MPEDGHALTVELLLEALLVAVEPQELGLEAVVVLVGSGQGRDLLPYLGLRMLVPAEGRIQLGVFLERRSGHRIRNVCSTETITSSASGMPTR